jgi:hypothetical protein
MHKNPESPAHLDDAHISEPVGIHDIQTATIDRETHASLPANPVSVLNGVSSAPPRNALGGNSFNESSSAGVGAQFASN